MYKLPFVNFVLSDRSAIEDAMHLGHIMGIFFRNIDYQGSEMKVKKSGKKSVVITTKEWSIIKQKKNSTSAVQLMSLYLNRLRIELKIDNYCYSIRVRKRL